MANRLSSLRTGPAPPHPSRQPTCPTTRQGRPRPADLTSEGLLMEGGRERRSTPQENNRYSATATERRATAPSSPNQPELRRSSRFRFELSRPSVRVANAAAESRGPDAGADRKG